MTIKPIETVFDGYKFRSRLEARWGVFFKTLGVPYEYEVEGFDLDGTWYLPDFWLPEQDCWVEIKGQPSSRDEREKALRLAQLSSYRVYVFEGSFCIPNIDKGIYPIAANAFFHLINPQMFNTVLRCLGVIVAGADGGSSKAPSALMIHDFVTSTQVIAKSLVYVKSGVLYPLVITISGLNHLDSSKPTQQLVKPVLSTRIDITNS